MSFKGTKQVEDCIQNLKKDFALCINVSPKLYTVNVRRSSKVVRELVEDLTITLKNLLDIYEACQDMKGALSEWDREHLNH